MLVTLLGIFIVARLEHPSNNFSSMQVKSLGRLTEESEVQPPKADEPIFVTLLGMEILDNAVQPEKAPESMFVTLFGIEMLCKLLQ